MPDYQSSLLVVDDEPAVRAVLVRVLMKAGYRNLTTASSSAEAQTALASKTVDLVLTDMEMPGGSGLELLTHIHKSLPGVATLMITVTDDAKLAEQVLSLGAYGYIIKPFRPSEILIGVSNALKRRDLERDNQSHRDRLEESVKLRTEDLWTTVVQLELSEDEVRSSRTETIERLAIAAEFRDEETGFHVTRMSRYCEALAKRCVEERLWKHIREASSLHDVGKIGIPDGILLKPGWLSPEERDVMEGHALIGHRILDGSESPLLKLAAEIALTHHEWVDGTGYPNGLRGDEIPVAGRIAAIADVFDAMTSNRIYRPAFPLPTVITAMKKETGTHFDAELLAIFWDVLPEILAMDRDSQTGDLTLDLRRGYPKVARHLEPLVLGGST